MSKRIDALERASAFTIVGRIAVARAMWRVLRGCALPYTVTSEGTSLTKLDPDDLTKAIDRAAQGEILDVLSRAVCTEDNPLSCGFFIVDEERGLDRMSAGSGRVDEHLVVFIDPVDFTAGASRGLDGSVLVSFYDLDQGFVAAVIGDLFHRKLYWRANGTESYCMSVAFDIDPIEPLESCPDTFHEPRGHPARLRPSERTSLEGAAVNIYLGKPTRLLEAAKLGSPLWQWNKDGRGIDSIFSVGGSLGPVRVAEGIWDASIEVVKGFRTWDFAPGAFLAEGAGASVVDLSGNPISFKLNTDQMRRHISARFRGAAMDECRQKFIVAATRELAAQIVELLKDDSANRLSNSEFISRSKGATHT